MSETGSSSDWKREDDPNRDRFGKQEPGAEAELAARLMRAAHVNTSGDSRTRGEEQRTRPEVRERATFELTRDRTREMTPDEVIQAQAEMARIAMQNAEEDSRNRDRADDTTARSRTRAPEPPTVERGRDARGRR